MGYYIDLKAISINDYKKILKDTELIPSWKLLEQDIDRNFNTIIENDINTLDELLIRLKDKNKIIDFSKKSGLSVKYLEVLKRVVNGYHQKPNKLKDFSCISNETIIKLEKYGIKDTLKLYDRIQNNEKRKELSQKILIDENEILKLAKLSDVSRIRWVNHTFAYILYVSGFDTVEKVARADYKDLHNTIKLLNEERKIYKANIGERDMKMIIDFANELDFEVEY